MRGRNIGGSKHIKRNHVGRRQELQECKICGESYDLEEDFLKHIRYEHKLSQASYFQEHHPRYDKHTGEIILFKSRDFYFDNQFNDKSSLKAWLTKQPISVQQEWCKEALAKRREEKGLVYTPGQTELRTIMIPSANYLNDIFGDYYKVCAEIGYRNKYQPLKGAFPFYPIDRARNRIIIDSREQKPLLFENFETVTRKLNEGDYALENESLSFGTRIERKSMPDFYGTLSTYNYDRFVREIDRIKHKGLKMVVLIEGSIEEAYSLPSLGKYREMKIGPEYVFHKMREVIQEFPFIQFLFAKNREDSVKIVEILLQSRGEFSQYDLQLTYDMGRLI